MNSEFYPLVTFKAKLGLRMFVIGYREDGYDIAPPIREHADHIIVQRARETGLDEVEYSAEFYVISSMANPTISRIRSTRFRRSPVRTNLTSKLNSILLHSERACERPPQWEAERKANRKYESKNSYTSMGLTPWRFMYGAAILYYNE
ncbi:hypothetical protein [Halosimplex marinum]|uniref:hypothetical protein n=1 Tax=Halosimplex marinum TaxID=3396620 RepID=UPI003F577BE9